MLFGGRPEVLCIFFTYHGGHPMAYPYGCVDLLPLADVVFIRFVDCKVTPTTLVMHYTSWDEVTAAYT